MERGPSPRRRSTLPNVNPAPRLNANVPTTRKVVGTSKQRVSRSPAATFETVRCASYRPTRNPCDTMRRVESLSGHSSGAVTGQ